MKKKPVKSLVSKNLVLVWRVVWVGFYVSILILNFFLQDSWLVKTISCIGIALNVVYVCYYSPKDHLLQIALAFTLLSDVILAVNNVAFLGVFVFVFAQFFHFMRLTEFDSRFFLVFLGSLTAIIYVTSLFGLEPMFVIGAFYAFLLVANLGISVVWYRRARTQSALSAMVGFLLFVLCDSCVAISYFARIGILPLAIHSYMDYMAWVFYYPSQVFLANSSKNQKTMVQ